MLIMQEEDGKITAFSCKSDKTECLEWKSNFR